MSTSELKSTQKWGTPVVLLVLCGLLLPQPTSGTQAPDFSLPTPEGKQIRLSALRKNGPVLIDFWATWCKPCLKAMPKLVELHERFKDRGLTVLGVNEDGPRSRTKVKPFIRAREDHHSGRDRQRWRGHAPVPGDFPACHAFGRPRRGNPASFIRIQAQSTQGPAQRNRGRAPR